MRVNWDKVTGCFINYHYYVAMTTDGAIVETKDDDDEVMEGEEGGGWEVEDDELELPPDLVSPVIGCS